MRKRKDIYFYTSMTRICHAALHCDWILGNIPTVVGDQTDTPVVVDCLWCWLSSREWRSVERYTLVLASTEGKAVEPLSTYWRYLPKRDVKL